MFFIKKTKFFNGKFKYKHCRLIIISHNTFRHNMLIINIIQFNIIYIFILYKL